MRQVFKLLFGLALLLGLGHADESETDSQYLPIDITIVSNYLPDKRRWDLVGYNNSHWVYLDTKTVEYDKKTKMLNGWFIWLYTHYGRERQIESAKRGGYYEPHKYDNLSHRKDKQQWSLSGSKMKSSHHSEYSTEGAVVSSFTPKNLEWNDIVPGSMGEAILESLKKRYR